MLNGGVIVNLAGRYSRCLQQGVVLELSQSSENPYSPPLGEVELSLVGVGGGQEYKPRNWLASIGIWSLVCTVSAVPSFFWGLSTVASSQAVAMLLGVLIFIVGYVVADLSTQGLRWRRSRSLRLALKVGYVTRLAISIIFPVGGFLDMFCGLFSLTAVEFVFGADLVFSGGANSPEAGFGLTLATTLVQGVVLNLVLSVYVLLVFGIVVIIHRDVK